MLPLLPLFPACYISEFTNLWSSHPENLDEMEEDDDETEPAQPPPMPELPDRFRNGGQ